MKNAKAPEEPNPSYSLQKSSPSFSSSFTDEEYYANEQNAKCKARTLFTRHTSMERPSLDLAHCVMLSKNYIIIINSNLSEPSLTFSSPISLLWRHLQRKSICNAICIIITFLLI